MNNKQFIAKMKRTIKDHNYSELRRKVATMLIDQLEGYDTPLQMFEDLMHGCESGIVGSLIYYVDTHAFAKEYIEDIMELYQDMTDNLGEAPKMEGDALNWLAWFGFEETARNIGLEFYPDEL